MSIGRTQIGSITLTKATSKAGPHQPRISTKKQRRRGNAGLPSGVRVLDNKGSSRGIAVFRSLSCAAMIVVDSLLEWHYCFWLDFSRFVSGIFAQPFTMEYVHHGKQRSTTPDFLVVREDRAFKELVEIKTARDASDPEFRAEVASRMLAARALGYRYKVITDESIRAEPALSNLMEIHYHAGLGWDVDTASLLCHIQLPATLSELADQLARSPIDVNAVYAAIQRRDLHVDITEPLTQASLVSRSGVQ